MGANSEALINKQINMELHASYVYMSMAAYFDRDDIALPGFAKRFQANSEEERDHAMKLIKYQNMRGGRVVFQDVAKAKTDDWISALSAVEASLEMLLVSTSLTKSSNKPKAQITPTNYELTSLVTSIIINFACSISSASLVKL